MSQHDNVEHHLIQALSGQHDHQHDHQHDPGDPHQQHHVVDPDDTTDPALTGPPPVPAVPIVHSIQPTHNTAKDPFSVLSRIPPDIAQVRQQLFLLEEPVEFSSGDWDKYWPYVMTFEPRLCC
jgi:hypothetical protein